jgi:hypothetical protein
MLRNRDHGYAIGGCSYSAAPKKEEKMITIAMKIKIRRTECEEEEGNEEEDEE